MESGEVKYYKEKIAELKNRITDLDKVLAPNNRDSLESMMTHEKIMNLYGERNKLRIEEDIYESEIRALKFDCNRAKKLNRHREKIEALNMKRYGEETEILHQELLRKIVCLNKSHSQSYFLDYDTKTIQMIDSYLESNEEFLILEKMFYCSENALIFKGLLGSFMDIDLIVVRDPNRYRIPRSGCYGFTVSELKKRKYCFISKYDLNNYQNSCEQFSERDGLYGLMEYLLEIVSLSKKTELIYENAVVFEKYFTLYAQSSYEKYNRKYGETDGFYIIGARFR